MFLGSQFLLSSINSDHIPQNKKKLHNKQTDCILNYIIKSNRVYQKPYNFQIQENSVWNVNEGCHVLNDLEQSCSLAKPLWRQKTAATPW